MKGTLTLAILAAFVALPLTANAASLAVPLSSADGYDNSMNHTYEVSAVDTTVVRADTRNGTIQSPGDDGRVDVQIGFNFEFFGTDYSAIQLSGNGHVYFGTGYDPRSKYINGGNGNAAHPEDNGGVIHKNYNGPRADFYWEDLDSSEGGTVITETRGVEPNREFVVEYDRVPPFDNDLLTTVQMILHEGSNEITMNYIDVNGPGTARNGLAIGIQGSSSKYLQYGWFPESGGPLAGNGIPANGESLLFSRIPEPTSFVLLAVVSLGLITSRNRRRS